MIKRFCHWLMLLTAIMGCHARVYGYANDGEDGGPHRKINQIALKVFAEKAAKDPILGKYNFFPTWKEYNLFDSTAKDDPFIVEYLTVTVKGDWYKDDKLIGGKYCKEDKARDTFAWWIIEGGFNADEPEAFMALRHFYDPKNPAAPHLTDLTDGYIGYWVAQSIFLMGENPKVNARDWALYGSRHSLQEATRSFADVAKPVVPADRAEPLGKTWRCLGESMHLLADMTVPAHVRNDGHPGQNTRMTSEMLGKYVKLGNLKSDPYEDYVNATVVVRYAANPLEERLKKEIEDCTKTRDLFDLVALYTNTKFFSTDTIAGTDAVTGNAVTSFNGQPDYNSPRLDNCTYDGAAAAKPAVNVQIPKNNPLGGLFNAVRDTANVVRDTANTLTPAKSSGFYTRKDSLGEILMARRESTGTHRISEQCADSQASRLIPIAVAANVRLLELTFPRVAVEITDFDAKNKILKCRMLSFEPDDKGEYDAKSKVPLNYVPTCQASVIVLLKTGNDTEGYWQPIASIRAGDFDVKLDGIPNHKLLAYLNRDPKNPPDTPVTLAIGLDMAGVVVKSDDFNLQNLAITPAEVELAPSATQLFRTSSIGTKDDAILWSVREKDGGTISSDGNYKAPTTPGTYHVTAALKSDPTKNAVARVAVVVHEAVAVATKQTTDDVGLKVFKQQIGMFNYNYNAKDNALHDTTRYGFRYYSNRDRSKGMPTGWAKIIYEGKENANSGSTEEPFWIYYAPDVSLQHRGNAVDDKLPADGSPFPAALRDIEAMHKSTKGTPQDVKIGDICCVMPSGFPDEIVAHAWRGPLYLTIRVQLKVGSRFSGFLNYDSCKNDKRYAEAINIKNKAIADMPNVAMALAADVMNDLDTWCGRRVANGHGIKGLYNPIAEKRYLPTPAELSKDISAGTYAGEYTYKIGDVEKARYTTTFSTVDMTEDDELATAPITKAHSDFEARVKYNTSTTYAAPEKISIPGADEAVEFKANPEFSRGDAKRFHRIMFRVANTYVTIDSFYDAPDYAPQSPHGNQLAKLIIAKLTKH